MKISHLAQQKKPEDIQTAWRDKELTVVLLERKGF
jgi:hypothetical protein